MSNFTTKPPHAISAISLEEGGVKGQVDIMVSAPDGATYRVAALGYGKLHLFRFNTEIAKEIGLELDADAYPIITRAR